MKIAGKIVPAVSAELTHEKEQLDNLSFVLPRVSEFSDLIAYKATILATFLSESRFDGKLDKWKPEGENLRIYARDKLLDLETVVFSKDQGQADTRQVKYRQGQPSTILSDILSGTSFSGNAPTTPLTDIRFERKYRLECIRDLARAINKDWWRSNSTVYIGTRGSNKGTIREVENADQDEDPKEVFNRILMKGTNLEGDLILVSVEDSGSITTYGLKEYPCEESSAASTNSITQAANRLLAAKKDPYKLIAVTANPQEVLKRFPCDTVSVNFKDVVGSWKIDKINLSEKRVAFSLNAAPRSTVDELLARETYQRTVERHRATIGEGDDWFGTDAYRNQKVTQAIGESEDGWYIEYDATYGEYSIEKDLLMVGIKSGAGGSIWTQLRPTSRGGNCGKSPSFQTVVWRNEQLASIDSVIFYCYDANPPGSPPIQNGFGFWLIGTGSGIQVWAICADENWNSSSVQLSSSLVANQKARLTAKYTTDKQVDFFFNGVHEGKLTNYLPDPAYSAYTMWFYLRGGASAGRQYCSNFVHAEKW